MPASNDSFRTAGFGHQRSPGQPARGLIIFRLAVVTLGALALCSAAFADPVEVISPGQPGPVSWTDYVRALWPIVAVIGGLITTGILLGLATRFVTTTAFERLKQRVDKLEVSELTHAAKIVGFEQYCASSPTRQELSESIHEVGARMSGVEEGLKAVRTTMHNSNNLLQIIVDNGLRREGSR